MNKTESLTKNNIRLTVLVPVFQEAETIEASLEKLYSSLDNLGYAFEIIVADDGSSDHCDRIVLNLRNKYNNLRFIRQQSNRGRGSVLTSAIKRSRGDIISYIDADLQIDPEVLQRLAQCVEDGFHVAIGSKHHPGSELRYSAWRRILSLVYNRLARAILNVDILDFQCGAKAFKRASIFNLLSHLTCKGWSWDTELLLKARASGYRVAEIPVTVRPNSSRRSCVSFRSVVSMIWHLFRLWTWSRKKERSFARTHRGRS